MTDETNHEDPVEKSKQFSKEVDDFSYGGHRNKRMVQVLVALVLAMIILVGAVVVQAFNANHTATVARESELSTYQSCLNRNVQDVDQIGLWRYVIELTGDKKLQTLQKYINSIFAERQCVNSPPSQTVAYDFHNISHSTLTPGDKLIITDRKCVPIKVHVYASIVWIQESPSHVVLPELTKSENLNAGCYTHRHADAVPPDVQAIVKSEFAAGAASTTWEVSGTETPAPSNMDVSTWKTPEFKIIP